MTIKLKIDSYRGQGGEEDDLEKGREEGEEEF
jgi:hypothetical protein